MSLLSCMFKKWNLFIRPISGTTFKWFYSTWIFWPELRKLLWLLSFLNVVLEYWTPAFSNFNVSHTQVIIGVPFNRAVVFSIEKNTVHVYCCLCFTKKSREGFISWLLCLVKQVRGDIGERVDHRSISSAEVIKTSFKWDRLSVTLATGYLNEQTADPQTIWTCIKSACF